MSDTSDAVGDADAVYRGAPRASDPPTGSRRMAPATEVITGAFLLVALAAVIYRAWGG